MFFAAILSCLTTTCSDTAPPHLHLAMGGRAPESVTESPVATPSVSAARSGKSSVGVGLNGVSDWSTQWPFLDVFKTSREWIGHVGSAWGAGDPQAIRAVQDAQGWLTRMPDGITHVSAIVLTSLPYQMGSAAGTYRLTWQGKGKIVVHGASRSEYGDGQILFDYLPTGMRHVSIDLTQIDPDDPIRDIRLVHQRHAALLDQGQIFNPEWLARIDDMALLRFMDWMRTNDSTQQEWQDRPQVNDATWTTPAGVPLEIMIALANETGTNPWFTLPHLASDDYIREFARQVRASLDPGLTPWFEYSNEVWNWQFGQAQWANEQGRALWPDEGTAWVQFYAGQSVRMARIIDEIYPEDGADVVKVISTQTGWEGLEEAILNAPDWQKLDAGGASPASYFDAYAITGYFDGGLGRDEKAPMVREWLALSQNLAEKRADAEGLSGMARLPFLVRHSLDHALDLAAQELRDGSVSGDDSGSLQALFRLFAYHKKVADQHGLTLTMYEGGTHVVGVGDWANDPDLTRFFVKLNYAPQMGAIYNELLQGWKDQGGTLFNAFVDIAGPGQFGSWGHLRHLDDQTVRWQALESFGRDNPVWWK